MVKQMITPNPLSYGPENEKVSSESIFSVNGNFLLEVDEIKRNGKEKASKILESMDNNLSFDDLITKLQEKNKLFTKDEVDLLLENNFIKNAYRKGNQLEINLTQNYNNFQSTIFITLDYGEKEYIPYPGEVFKVDGYEPHAYPDNILGFSFSVEGEKQWEKMGTFMKISKNGSIVSYGAITNSKLGFYEELEKFLIKKGVKKFEESIDFNNTKEYMIEKGVIEQLK